MTTPGRRTPALVDRSTLQRSRPGLLDDALADATTLVVDLLDGAAPVADAPDGPHLALRAPEPADGERDTFFLGRLEGPGSEGAAVIAVAANTPDGSGGAAASGSAGHAPTDTEPTRRTLRDVGALLDDRDTDLYLTALALTNWHRTHTHCPRCGGSTRIIDGGWVRECTFDGSHHYPRTDPAVIMAVVDPDDRLLLARNPTWPQGRRSVLAGFVEPGERLEAAVAREVAEEVGVTVHDVVYRDSQPWPFPASLMLGFTSRCDDPALELSPDEIAEADWYTREQLASAVADGSLGLPGRLSIARRLIEGWYGSPLVAPDEATRGEASPAPSDEGTV